MESLGFFIRNMWSIFFRRKNVFQKNMFFVEFGFKYNTNIAPESQKVPNIKEICQLKKHAYMIELSVARTETIDLASFWY